LLKKNIIYNLKNWNKEKADELMKRLENLIKIKNKVINAKIRRILSIEKHNLSNKVKKFIENIWVKQLANPSIEKIIMNN